MKKRLIHLALFVIALATAANAGAQWTAQVSTSEGLLNDVNFADDRTGWAVGDSGAILKTTDRGQNWAVEASGTAVNLNGVFLMNTTSGWAAGDSRTVVKYDGTSWTASQITHPANMDITSVTMTSVSTIWATTGLNFSGSLANFRNMFYSTDGGSSWNSATIRNTAEATTILNYLYSAYFTDAANGWAVGINNDTTPMGKVFRTTDGGTSWADVSPLNTDNVVLRDVYFLNTSEGWAVGGNAGTNNGYIYRTINGGASWEAQFTFSPALFKGIDAADSSNIWASDRASLFKYDGSAWAEDSTPLSVGYFTNIHLRDRWNGWAVGGRLAAEGGPNRYIYKYIVDVASVEADKTLYISPTTYEVVVGIGGVNIHSNAIFTLEAGSGLVITTYEAKYESVYRRNRLDVTFRVDPSLAVVGAYTFTVTNPDDNTSDTGTLTVMRAALPTEKPTAIPVAEKIFDPATEAEIKVMVGTPGEITSSGMRAFGPVAMATDVPLELIVYRFSNRQIAYRKRFFADPDGYTTVTLKKVTDLGLDISEGVYNAIVIHPQYGKIGSGMLVVHYSR